ncbi:hypothetical protein [Sphingomonas sp. STIS6.2]|uniref:hypothetical protein n=1 Tax=Sphingomonas sp. STIS6.2 TaxID=1379700 RepID=UPI0018FE991B|nr:hypothetical protein [Sphingomonas sp. STIS6.2]
MALASSAHAKRCFATSTPCSQSRLRLQGKYGIEGVFLGTPCIAGKNGFELVIELELNDAEWEGMSAATPIVKDLKRK